MQGMIRAQQALKVPGSIPGTPPGAAAVVRSASGGGRVEEARSSKRPRHAKSAAAGGQQGQVGGQVSANHCKLAYFGTALRTWSGAICPGSQSAMQQPWSPDATP